MTGDVASKPAQGCRSASSPARHFDLKFLLAAVAWTAAQTCMIELFSSVMQRSTMVPVEIQPINLVTAAKSSTLLQRGKRLLIVLALLGMCVLYVLTLLNDVVHAAGYSALQAVVASVVPKAAASRLLSKSTTVVRQGDAALATKKLLNEKDALAAGARAAELRELRLAKSIREMETVNGTLKHMAETRSAAVMTASKRLALRSATNAARNASSVVAEALPVVGTAVMLGVTAWDLRDACETLKDLNELNSVFDHPREDYTQVCGMKVPTKDEVLASVKVNGAAAYQAALQVLKHGGQEVRP